MTGGEKGLDDDYPNTPETEGRLSENAHGIEVHIDQPGDQDAVNAWLTGGQRYSIVFEGADDDNPYTLSNTYLSVQNVFGKEIKSNWRGGDGYDAQITYTPQNSGIYTIIGESHSSAGTGSGRISLFGGNRGPSDDYASNLTTTGALESGETVGGSIDAPGDEDWFAVNLVGGRAYTVNMIGNHDDNPYTLVNTYLGLYNSNRDLRS